jgi:hypothetical protein
VPELPPRYAFRLEDVRAWHLVEASCRRCRHRAPVDHQLLLRGRPLYTRLYDIERALRCLRCGARGRPPLPSGCGLATDTRPAPSLTGLRYDGWASMRRRIMDAKAVCAFR